MDGMKWYLFFEAGSCHGEASHCVVFLEFHRREEAVSHYEKLRIRHAGKEQRHTIVNGFAMSQLPVTTF
jgi:hypothetical protein